jgi:hypothetical protein
LDAAEAQLSATQDKVQTKRSPQMAAHAAPLRSTQAETGFAAENQAMTDLERAYLRSILRQLQALKAFFESGPLPVPVHDGALAANIKWLEQKVGHPP